ncbi:MAG: hypothetical protein KDC38_01575 [Planctomycetes bacterium]|nr:hypothetical protein [Planctomycetota bacterium]
MTLAKCPVGQDPNSYATAIGSPSNRVDGWRDDLESEMESSPMPVHAVDQQALIDAMEDLCDAAVPDMEPSLASVSSPKSGGGWNSVTTMAFFSMADGGGTYTEGTDVIYLGIEYVS